MMRHPWLSLLLCVLLQVVQLGAFGHEIGHQRAPAVTLPGQQPEQVADGLCTLCLAFSQLAAFARPVAVTLPASVASHVQRPGRPASSRTVRGFRARNRDPPDSA